MSRVDRAVRRARQHLDPGEVLLVSAWGVEAEGRRARVVVVTDRRVIVGWRRPGQPDVLSVSTTASFDHAQHMLTLTDGDTVVGLRDVDPREGHQVVHLLDRAHTRPLAERLGGGNHVRILSA